MADKEYPETTSNEITKSMLNSGYDSSTIKETLNLDSAFVSDCNINIIFERGDLCRVKELTLRENKLHNLPKSFPMNLKILTKLDLSINNLKELPDDNLHLLGNLEQLIVDSNYLSSLPSSIGVLKNLKSLIVSNNHITEIPASIGDLTKLEELNLRLNKIKTLPDSCARLDSLKTLLLSHNFIKTSPKCISEGMPGLETLDLSSNPNLAIDAPPSSKVLKKFYLSHNKSTKRFPNWLLTTQFSHLEELILDDTQFSEFDVSNKNSAALQLRKLSMIKCGLSDTVFEKISSNMWNLEHLNVGNDGLINEGNLFWVMPVQNLKNPLAITELNVQGVGLPAMPQEINTLKNLKKLDASRNNISWLPNEICDLDKLELLNMGHNGLCMIPQDIGRMTDLKELLLETNGLSSLPDSITKLRHLESLDLYSNDFTEVPPQLLEIETLKALDIDGNVCKAENMQFAGTSYTDLREALRDSCYTPLRCLGPILEESNESLDGSGWISSDSDSDYFPNVVCDDGDSTENWDVSDDSADEFDPTVPEPPTLQRRHFTLTPMLLYGNFCPADLHKMRVKDQVAIMKERENWSGPSVEEGQFDDA